MDLFTKLIEAKNVFICLMVKTDNAVLSIMRSKAIFVLHNSTKAEELDVQKKCLQCWILLHTEIERLPVQTIDGMEAGCRK